MNIRDRNNKEGRLKQDQEKKKIIKFKMPSGEIKDKDEIEAEIKKDRKRNDSLLEKARMAEIANSIANSEFLWYLKGFDEKYTKMIPKGVLEIIERNRAKSYTCSFDYTKPLSELELTSRTHALINLICYKYWCANDEERNELLEKWKENSLNQGVPMSDEDLERIAGKLESAFEEIEKKTERKLDAVLAAYGESEEDYEHTLYESFKKVDFLSKSSPDHKLMKNKFEDAEISAELKKINKIMKKINYKYPVFRNVKSYAKATEDFEYFYNAKTPEDAEKADEDRRLILGLKMAT